MKYYEFKKEVSKLSKNYHFEEDDVCHDFIVYHKSQLVAKISDLLRFQVELFVSDADMNSLPFSHKLYMLMAELSMTKPHNREVHLGFQLANCQYLTSFSANQTFENLYFSERTSNIEMNVTTTPQPYYGLDRQSVEMASNILAGRICSDIDNDRVTDK